MHVNTFILINTITIIGFLQINSITNDIVIPKKRSSERFLAYQIDGFNRIFNLTLIQDEKFLSPLFTFQYFHQNQTWINRDIEHCFYQGYVNDDYSSFVSISLCNGLFGTFIYDNVEYFIEPKYHRNDTLWNFEHLLYINQDLSVSNNRCPVDGKPNVEEREYPHYIRRKRQIDMDPMAKHVEILVAYDNSLREFHSDIDVKSYILTLFGYVSHLYSDASIGNNIKIWVVKLIELGRDLTVITDDAADILNQFCQWQRDYNIPENYDAAVLLTRMRLCNNRAKTDGKCDTLGLTELGTMCNLTSNCAVVRDNGFATAFTIAHEIAHLFGIRHDNDKICLNFNKEQNLMATSLLFDHNHYKWSNCSRFYFTQYLESNRYPCLNNIPDDQSWLFKDLNNERKIREFPGYFSDLDDQCRRAFGINFEYCKDLSHSPKCIRLYCREISSSSSLCITNHAHWSDGTVCSESRMTNKVRRCFRGQCRNTEDFKIINGNWGDWSSWSSCTRTCGSAVQKSQRFCDNPKPENGGRYCSGQSTRIRSCEDNPPCKDSFDTFRQLQCSRYNNRSIDLTLPHGIRFEPKYNVLPSERCKLICKVSNDRLERSFIFNDRVEDGTPCSHNAETRDICINGICMSFGCDYKYGSNATEDICGVCNGQNRTCKLINGRKTISNLGITNIVHIPFNTTHVSITQISREKNDRYYLAVKYSNGTYLLNSLHDLQSYQMKIRFDSSTLFYTGFESDNNESILITGRLKFSLDIEIISMYESETLSTEVYWEYYIPLDEDEDCNRPCQGLKRIKKCRIYCMMFKKSFDYENERCNDHCILNWTKKDEGICSTRCGNGYKRVLYQCTKTGVNTEIIDEEICRKYVGEKPENNVPCVADCTGTGWVYGEWSECYYDGTCLRKRSVECRNSSNLIISNQYCDQKFIFNTERCAEVACEQSKWNFSIWSDCDCMLNRRRRDVSCIRYGKKVNDYQCLYESKPAESISCVDECLKPHWKIFSWQSCTSTCLSDKGLRYRRIVCVYQGSIVQDEHCDRQLKPVENEWCTKNISCAIWLTSEWSSCSVTCGNGIQHRRVLCKNQDEIVSFEECDELKKPIRIKQCRISSCQDPIPVWITSNWTQCDLRTCIQTRTSHCVDLTDRRNLSISQCTKIQVQLVENRTCPISDCLEWRVAHWHGCPVKCGLGIENGSDYHCYTRQMLIRRMNTSECESVEPPLIKPILRRICRKNCIEWRTGNWAKVILNNTSSNKSFSLLFFSIIVGIQIIHSSSDFLL